MKRMATLISLIILAATNVLAQSMSQTGQGKQSKAEFFPIDQVKPGMRAVGYTVFSGAEPKKFDVEILGVLKGFPNPQQKRRCVATARRRGQSHRSLSGDERKPRLY